jgi:integrase
VIGVRVPADSIPKALYWDTEDPFHYVRLQRMADRAADHLRPAAKKAGVHIEDGQRFGLHNLRHSLSNWLVNKAKVEPKTVQGLLRHSKIQTTLDLYTQEDSDETRAAQGEFLTAVGMNVTVQ